MGWWNQCQVKHGQIPVCQWPGGQPGAKNVPYPGDVGTNCQRTEQGSGGATQQPTQTRQVASLQAKDKELAEVNEEEMAYWA